MESIESQPWASALFGMIVLLGAAWLLHVILRRYVTIALSSVLRRVAPRLGESEASTLFAARLLALPPYALVYYGVTAVPGLDGILVTFVQQLALALGVILAARALAALLDVAHAMYLHHPASGGKPIKGYVQVVKLVVYIVATVLAVAAIANKSPLLFLSGLGAMTAVILLIFKDTLLSLVAGVQLINNDLVRVGDWIEMPQFDADGDVIDISLNVVRVQNWDRTITAIPAHRFLEYSFRNWRGMFESGGRRIARTLYLDMSSVRFLTQEEISHYRSFLLLKDHIEAKERELAEWNAANCPPDGADIRANVRMLTNIGLFRAYVLQYLARHPHIHHEQMILVRQMEPGPNGVGIQVYAFANDTRWVFYEGIQSDIFDHLIAVVPEFGLRVFQSPSGNDLSALARELGSAQMLPAASERRITSD
jgi:miniconductance mechanosensitive channel